MSAEACVARRTGKETALKKILIGALALAMMSGGMASAAPGDMHPDDHMNGGDHMNSGMGGDHVGGGDHMGRGHMMGGRHHRMHRVCHMRHHHRVCHVVRW